MKCLVVFLLVWICGVSLVNSQNFESLKEVKFSNRESFNEYREQVTDCCYYVLQTPNDKKDDERKYAIEFVTRWMKEYPDCKFRICEEVKQMIDERDELIGLYTVSYAAVYMDGYRENSNKDGNSIREDAVARFLNYCAEDMNKIKLTKEMKKVIQLKADGQYSSIENVYAIN